jgi:hypothetical protein
MKNAYTIVQKGSGWTASGPTPDRIISKHSSLKSAYLAFSKCYGPAVLLDPDKNILESRLA